jgi:hypothetical protein
MPMRNELTARAPRWSGDRPHESSRFSPAPEKRSRDLSAVVVFCVCGLISIVGLTATVYAAYHFPSFGDALALLGQY